ncbi:hypothetical protein [Alienimonas californiensis]|uniref:Uncharacterized protein n=1 Tax=Alienimonas californiensis TaxID=2527989 RepID=A0A517P4H8_9PLAN|nr:hypothetical protein [Alienimonas californiensis]QDT14255.1 hypothetical protein CA12_03260 [Alienimonas californiensis]
MSPSTVPANPPPDERPLEFLPQQAPPRGDSPAADPSASRPAPPASEASLKASSEANADDGLADAVREALQQAASRSGRTSRADAARAVADTVIGGPPAEAAPAPILPPGLQRRARDWIAERLLHDPAARERLDALRGRGQSTGGRPT